MTPNSRFNQQTNWLFKFIFMKKIYFTLSILICTIFLSATLPPSDDVFSILKKMISQTDQIKGMQYEMKQVERIDGKLVDQKSLIKYDRVNFKIYAKQLVGGTEGLEVLYHKGWNNKKALINPNGFPWINVSLSPFGNQMRSGQHHTLLDVGYELFAPIMESMLNRHGDAAINSMAKNKGTRTFDGRQVWDININNSNFKWIDYVVKKGETLITIASKNKTSEYMIMMKNKGVDSYTDVKVGQTIKIPTEYAARITLFIDQQTSLPLVLKIYDDEGLFEHYEFLKLQIDPLFKSDEFSKNHKHYGF